MKIVLVCITLLGVSAFGLLFGAKFLMHTKVSVPESPTQVVGTNAKDIPINTPSQVTHPATQDTDVSMVASGAVAMDHSGATASGSLASVDPEASGSITLIRSPNIRKHR